MSLSHGGRHPNHQVGSGRTRTIHFCSSFLFGLQFAHNAYHLPCMNRALAYSPNNKFTCLPFHRLRRLVCGWQDHQQGYMVGYGIGMRRHWNVCGFEDTICMMDWIWVWMVLDMSNEGKNLGLEQPRDLEIWAIILSEASKDPHPPSFSPSKNGSLATSVIF